MKVEGRERVPVAREEAWRRLNDPEVLLRCTPGLARLEETSPGHFEGVLELELPVVRGRFAGTVDYLEQWPPERLRLRLKGKGSPGFVDGEATLALAPADGGTEVHYAADAQVGGQVARLGQRMLDGVVKEMAGQFFEAFARDAAGEPARKSPVAAFVQLAWRTFLNLLGLSRRA